MMYRTVLLAVLVVALGASIGAQDEHALAELRARAEAGDAEAQFNLGVMYDTLEGVPVDLLAAARWYRLAAAQGHAAAQFNLGFAYRRGRGVPQDGPEAVAWFRRAYEQRRHDLNPICSRAWFHIPGRRWRSGGLHRGGGLVPRRRRAGRCLLSVQPRAHVRHRTWRAAGRCRSRALVPVGRRAGPHPGAVQPRSSCTPPDLACRRTTPKPPPGGAWPPSRATPPPSSTSGSCTTKAVVCRRTTPKP